MPLDLVIWRRPQSSTIAAVGEDYRYYNSALQIATRLRMPRSVMLQRDSDGVLAATCSGLKRRATFGRHLT